MALWYFYLAALLGVVTAASGFADDGVVITPKQQKEAHNATAKPSRGELPWGKMNFIHTTDTHGWLEGHLNEPNYGADWGDFVSFVKRMRAKADDLKVDLLVADTGDLHDGNGLSDITKPKGAVSDHIFANVDYDFLTIGNHGVQRLEEARNIQANIAHFYGERYLTSNVYINATGKDESIGVPYRSFTTNYNTRVMAFGVLFDDGKNDNKHIKIETAEQMMKRPWFAEAMKKEVDLYVLLGHSSINITDERVKNGAFLSFQRALRAKLTQAGKDTPIQLLGGHTHVRDFRCFDEGLTSGLESGKYGDTVGWLALDNFVIKGWSGAKNLENAVTPQRSCAPKKRSEAPLLDRRYLDWNVLTFMYHSISPNETDTGRFDTYLGRKVTWDIESARHALNLTSYLGCADRTWCLWCNNLGDQKIMELAKPAALETVVSGKRRDKNRAVILTGTSFRYDLFQGPFTLGDALAVVPYSDQFYYVEVNYATYQEILNISKLHVSEIYPPGRTSSPVLLSEKVSSQNVLSLRAADEPFLTPGYTTTDDLGKDGDDTEHSEFTEMGPNLPTVALQSWESPSPSADFKLDLVVSNHSEPIVRGHLHLPPLPLYMEDFTTADILPEYARRHWANTPPDDCPVAPKGS